MEQESQSDHETKSRMSRRVTRMYHEERRFMEAVTASRESQSSSSSTCGEEIAQEYIEGRTRRSSITIDIRTFPTVDVGKDLSNAFPKTAEDMGKQVAQSLQAAASVRGQRTDGRPMNFGEVIPGRIYRSSFPIEEDFQFLKTLGLKTVVSLVKKDFSAEFQGFIRDNSISHRVIHMEGTKKIDVPEHTMKAIMEVVLDKENYPVLIHCKQGRHRTGCAVGVLRHVTGWNTQQIIEEYCGYAAPKVRECDIKYLTQYQVSNLHHLFTKHEIQPRRSSYPTSRMAQLVLFAAVVLAVWLTCVFW